MLVDEQGAPYFELPFRSLDGDEHEKLSPVSDELLADLVGTVRDDGTWEWDGGAELRDGNRNSVLAIWIRSDRDQYEAELADHEAEA